MAPRINPDSGLVRDGTAITRERLRPTRQIRNPQITDSGAGKDLEQLSRALADVAPALGRFSDQLAQEQQQSDTLKGQQLARDLAASGKSYGQAIKEGKISPSESPWFRYGAEEQFGRVAASRFGAALKSALLTGPLKDSTDPNDFDKFLGDFRANWLKDNAGEAQSQAFNVGFADSDQDIESARNAFVTIAGKNLESKVLDDAYELQRRAIDANGTDLEATAKAITQANAERVALNPNSGREVARTTVKAVIDAARKANDPSLLKLLDLIPGGQKGSKLSNVAEFADQIADADSLIRSERQQRLNFDEKQAKRARIQGIDDTYSDFVTALEQAGDGVATFDVTPFVSRLVNLREGDQTEKLYKIRDAYAKRTKGTEEEQMVNDLLIRAAKGTLTLDAATDALAEGSIKPATFTKLLGMIKKTRSGGDGQPLAVFSERPLSLGLSSIKNVFGAEFGFDNREAASRAQLAADEFTTNYIAYRDGEGADATPEQIKAFVDQQRDTLFAKYAGPAIAGGGSIPDIRKIQESVGGESKATTPAPTGPQPVDWKKEPVTDAQTFTAVVSAVEAAASGRAALPNKIKTWLTSLGINQSNYLEFVQTQSKLIAAQNNQ